MVKNPPANVGDTRDPGSIPGQEDPLEKETATHSSIVTWRIPWTGEPGSLQSMGSQRVGHDWEAEGGRKCICEVLSPLLPLE